MRVAAAACLTWLQALRQLGKQRSIASLDGLFGLKPQWRVLTEYEALLKAQGHVIKA